MDQNGSVYYQNNITKTTQWIKPTISEIKTNDGTLPNGWRKKYASDGGNDGDEPGAMGDNHGV